MEGDRSQTSGDGARRGERKRNQVQRVQSAKSRGRRTINRKKKKGEAAAYFGFGILAWNGIGNRKGKAERSDPMEEGR